MLVTPQALAISCPVATQRPIGLVRRSMFGDPRRHRLCLGLTKFSQRQLGAAAEALWFDPLDMAMAS